MAKAAASSALEDLDLSGEEVERLTSAFQDPEFRRMFSEYAEELTDPENRRRYEEEITALERERGVEVRFVHPEPGHVLRTSLDGVGRCYVNVCSNPLVGAPSSRPGSERGAAAAGSHWSLPYSLAPGRPYAGRRGGRYTVYDVVFHPDALALARRHPRFRHMLDTTALEAVEQQFGVRLDRRNAKTLKMKYKGTPEAAVLRTPLSEDAQARPEEEPESPLPDLPYPYRFPARAPPPPPPPEPAPPAAPQRPAPTEPRYRVVQRHHVDLQDYRCSRDSAPSPVPRELVVTIELPLLRSAQEAALEVTGKLLCLDSTKPDYRLRLPLPYPVDDSRGKAQFNKARRQLQVTLPVALPAACPAAPEESEAPSGTDGAVGDSGCEGPAEGRAGDPGRDPVTTPDGDPGPEPEERERSGDSLSAVRPLAASLPPDGDSPAEGRGALALRRDTSSQPAGLTMGDPGTEDRQPSCPPLQCNQDEESLTLLVQVPRIQPQSLQGVLNPLRYKLCFSAQDTAYSFSLQFAAHNKLSTQEPEISISLDNAVIVLVKSPECRGHWREWYCGLDDDALEERLFVSEENVNEFLEEVLSSPLQQAMPLTPPLIEVLQVTDEKVQIHAKQQECSNPGLLQGKERRVNEGSHLTEENIEPTTTSATDSDAPESVTALKMDACDVVAGLQVQSPDGPQVLFGKSQQPETKMEPECIKEMSDSYSAEKKDNLKETITKEKELDGDHLSSLPNKTRVHNTPDFDSIKETNMQDGSVQIIKDHTTHCAFSFENSLLYDLD
uniref:Protein kintoun n=1 Tax=Jaculus jaculus TaxID=51337 RepID=A0A8C5LBY4_JACJA